MAKADGINVASKEDSSVDTVAVAATTPIDTASKTPDQNADTTAIVQTNTTGTTTTVYGDYGTPVGDCGEVQKANCLFGLL